MKQQQATEKFCSILNRLTDEILEVISFYYDTAIVATEWELENDYEDTYYDTEVTVHDDLTATVNQLRKGYFDALTYLDRATVDKIAKGDLDIDEVINFQPVMDCPPDPNLPYDWVDSINESPKSRSWELTKHEVTKHLSSIIRPSFEDFLEKMKRGITDIKKLGITNSTIVGVLRLLQLLYNRGESIHVEYVEEIEKARPELPEKFVDDFKGYLSVYLDQTTIRRLEEFTLGMGFEITTNPQTENNEITMGKVNAKLCKLLPDICKTKGPKKATIRLLADKIGCSTGLISKCPIWQAFVEKQDNKQKTSSKTQRLNDVHLDTLQSNEPEPMQKLIAEQKADMLNQDGPNRAYPDR